jgi:hypothetical protein
MASDAEVKPRAEVVVPRLPETGRQAVDQHRDECQARIRHDCEGDSRRLPVPIPSKSDRMKRHSDHFGILRGGGATFSI